MFGHRSFPPNKEQASQISQIESDVELAKRNVEEAKDTWGAMDTASDIS